MQYITFVPYDGFVDLNPTYFGYEACAPSHISRGVRGGYLIHCVVFGCGTFKIRDKEYTVNSGELFVIPPGEEYFYQADAQNPWSYIWIGFDSRSPLSLADVIQCPQAIDVFNAMKKNTEYKNGRTAYLRARLWDLFALLLNSENYTMKYIDEALKYIYTEYMNEISVAEIAGRLNLNRTYFSQLFKKKLGKTPKQYLIDYRMDTAAFLLSTYQKSVSTVARSVGYTDPFTFSKAFKRYFGLSPSLYASTYRAPHIHKTEVYIEE